MISDADELAKMGKPHYIEEQGAQYEGLTVWFNSLVDSDGGGIITGPQQGGRRGRPPRSRPRSCTSSRRHPRADPSLNVTQEGQSDTSFDKGNAAFEINYPFVWQSAKATGPAVSKEMGYAPFPEVIAGLAPHVSIGGYNLGVSSHSPHPQLAFDAVQCLTQQKYEITYAVKGGLAPVRGAVYNLPSFEKPLSLPRADQEPAQDLRHPPPDAGLRGRHAGDPEGPFADLEHQPEHGGEHAA